MKFARRLTGWGLVGLVVLIGCGAPFTTAAPDGGGGGGNGDGGEPNDAEAGSVDGEAGPQDAEAGSLDGEAGSVDAEAGTGGGDASGECVSGSIEFEMNVASGTSTTYCAGPGGSCGPDWLSILPPGDGGALTIDESCTADCSNCQPVLCPAITCAASTPVTASGVKRPWDGTLYTAGTCGPTRLTCASASCAAAGHYVARMCGSPEADAGLGCVVTTTTTCVDVGFDWPPPDGGQSTVVGTLGSTPPPPMSDAGH